MSGEARAPRRPARACATILAATTLAVLAVPAVASATSDLPWGEPDRRSAPPASAEHPPEHTPAGDRPPAHAHQEPRPPAHATTEERPPAHAADPVAPPPHAGDPDAPTTHAGDPDTPTPHAGGGDAEPGSAGAGAPAGREQEGDEPGRSGDAPARSGEAPARSGEAPGRSGEAPGHVGDAPGRSGGPRGRVRDADLPRDDGPLVTGRPVPDRTQATAGTPILPFPVTVLSERLPGGTTVLAFVPPPAPGGAAEPDAVEPAVDDEGPAEDVAAPPAPPRVEPELEAEELAQRVVLPVAVLIAGLAYLLLQGSIDRRGHVLTAPEVAGAEHDDEVFEL